MKIDKEITEVKVSSKTDPKSLATSIIYSLNDNLIVKAISIGEAIKTAAKAVAMIRMILPEETELDLEVRFEYINTEMGIKNAIVWLIKYKE